MQMPSIDDVLEARERLAPYLSPTPLYRYPGLDEMVGAAVWVKHENHQPIAVFKIRGGINLLSQLAPAERARGVAAASTGNHGQSVAYAARLFDVPATICVPVGANPVKVDSMRDLGAEVHFVGRDFDDAREHCERLSEARGLRYVHAGNEPDLIAGVGTATLEILEDQPAIEAIVVPVGGGSGAAAACVVAAAMRPDVEIIGVQSEAAPAAYRSWKARALMEARMETFAEGLATRTAFDLPQRILWQMLTEFVLVSDESLRRAMILMIDKTRNLVEAAGAAPLAAALQLEERLGGKTIALMCTGGNVGVPALRELLAETDRN
jgi:threonine dehydratase